jgi:hypothetical protein
VARRTELGTPVTASRGEWEFRASPLFSEDRYFALHTTAFEPDAHPVLVTSAANRNDLP